MSLLKRGSSAFRSRYLGKALPGLAFTCLLLLVALQVIPAGPVQGIHRALTDTLQQLPASQSLLPSQVVVIDIDEKSLAHPQLGRWPWNRAVLSDVVQALFESYRIRVLAFDVIFSEPDTSSGLVQLNELSQTALKNNQEFQRALEQLLPSLDYDARFAETVANYPVVLGYYFSAEKGSEKLGLLPFPVLEEADLGGRVIDVPAWQGYGANLEAIGALAAASGHFSPLVDSDGVVRRIPLLAQYQGALYESLSLATYRMVQALQGDPAELRLPAIALLPTQGPVEAIEVGDLRLPVDLGLASLIPFAGGPKTIPYVSFADIVDGKVSREELFNKVAIVGTSAPGLLDLRATPVSGIYPGVEIHANLINAMLHNKPGVFKREPLVNQLVEPVLVLFLGLALSFAFAVLPAAASSVITLLLLGFGAALSAWLWQQGLIFPMATLGVLLLGLYLLSMAMGYFTEGKTKRQFASLFGQYVPPELVKKMAEDPEKYSMESRKAELTVVFSDLWGFTTISESLSPTELSAFINEYLTTMTNVIQERAGTVDKYIGDSIMAFWGAPIAAPDHAQQAVLATLAMKKTAFELQERFQKKGWPIIRMGFGVSTGEMTVGDMGSKVRKAYTVMGDSVNLGARLEGITRFYDAWILVSEATCKACTGIVFQEVDRVRVKGKERAVTIFEPICLESERTPFLTQELHQWHECLALYRGQSWPQAKQVLRALQAMNPNRTLYRIFESKLNENSGRGHIPDWDGATNFDVKK